MSLYDKSIHDPNVPVCEKHNFRGFCLECYKDMVTAQYAQQVKGLEAKITKLYDEQFEVFINGIRTPVVKVKDIEIVTDIKDKEPNF